jgi:integral membrane sensor domain MASE1
VLNNKVNEKSTTIVFLVISIIIAIILSPKNIYFLGNFAYYWLPQAIVFILLFVFKLRLAVIAGAAIALTLSLIGYSMFKDSMAWIGYVFIIPAGFLGALTYGLITKSKITTPYDEVIISSTVCTIIGIGIVQLILCSTVMYCGW